VKDIVASRVFWRRLSLRRPEAAKEPIFAQVVLILINIIIIIY